MYEHQIHFQDMGIFPNPSLRCHHHFLHFDVSPAYPLAYVFSNEMTKVIVDSPLHYKERTIINSYNMFH